MTSLEAQISQLEKTLSGNDHDESYKKEGRLAVVKTAAQEMNDDEKKEARKAFETKDEKKEARKAAEDEKKEAMKSFEDEKKEAMKSFEDEKKEARKATEDEKKEAMKSSEDDKDTKIATLTASVNYLTTKPIIDKMLTARRTAGMAPKDLEKFGHSLYGKSIDEIKERFNEDQIFYKKSLIATTEATEYPFNGIEGTLLASNDNKTLEELFN